MGRERERGSDREPRGGRKLATIRKAIFGK